MSLNSTLKQIRSTSRSKMPADAAATIAKATERLEKSGISRMALAAGKPAPGFELSDFHGSLFRSSELLKQGPLVLNFYRGSW